MKAHAVGSVVLLKGGEKPLVIYGRKQKHGDETKIWDYLGCLYPEGYVGDEYCFLFDEADIETVLFEGYVDQSEIDLLNSMEQFFAGLAGASDN